MSDYVTGIDARTADERRGHRVLEEEAEEIESGRA